jgi:hypothetical protein
VLAFVGRPHNYIFAGTTTDGYTGGSAFARSPITGQWTSWSMLNDFAFRTYIDAETVPEPTTMFLLGTGLFCLAGLRKKIK